MSNEPLEIQDWLRRLKWSLAAMPSPERDDIVEEARGHLHDAISRGATAEAALSGFGDPAEYARGFIDEMEVAGALGSQRTGAMLSVVAGRVHRSVVAAVAGVVMLALGAAVFAAVTMTIFKLSDPVHAGLWRGAHEFFIGKIDNPAEAQELLGNWLYVLAALAIALAWLIGRFVLLGTLRTLSRPR